MKRRSLRPVPYKSWSVDDNATPEARERLEKLETYRDIRSGGGSEAVALRAIKVSRSTYFLWLKRYREQGTRGLASGDRRPHHCRQPQWTKEDEQLVLKIRRKHPFWGKQKIRRVLAREFNVWLSESTVGRIISKALRLKWIKPCCFHQGRVKKKRPRDFSKGTAKRWKHGMRASKPGEYVQVDHMTVNDLPGLPIKEFRAVCPISKIVVTRAYRNATAINARRFLHDMREDFPFPIRSIQVDGGSEFMAEFEDECAKLGIELYVLPPNRPQYNGCVERANATSRLEFYSMYSGDLTIDALNEELAQYQHFYNYYRPHQGIGQMTPIEKLQQLGLVPQTSHASMTV